MSSDSDFEIQCSFLKSESDDDSKAQESCKKSKFSYSREFLLSISESDPCKELPSRFDSSILCGLKDSFITSSTIRSWSDSDSGRREANLSRPLQQNPHYGILGRDASLKEPGILAGVSADTVQDSGRMSNFTQQTQQNPNRGTLGGRAILRQPACLAEVSTPMVQSSGCHLLNKCATPYRPPHLYKMNLCPSTESKDLSNDKSFRSPQHPSPKGQEEERKQRDSFELLRKEQKAIERKLKDDSDEHRENLDPDIAEHPEDSKNHKKIIRECNSSRECVASCPPNNAWCSYPQDSSCIETLSPAFASISLGNGIGTKSTNHSPGQELISNNSSNFRCEVSPTYQLDVKVHQIESFALSSPNLVDQFTEGEIKPVGSISRDQEIEESENAKEPKYTSCFSQRNGVPQELKASTTHADDSDEMYKLQCDAALEMPPDVLTYEEIEQFIRAEISKNQFLPHQIIQYDDIENKQLNAVSNNPTCQFIFALSRKGKDATDLAGSPSNLKILTSPANANLVRNPTCETLQGTYSSKESLPREAQTSQRGSAAGLIKYYRGDLNFPAEREASPLLVAEFIKIKHKVDNTTDLDFPSEQELDLDSVTEVSKIANAIDEICWPDEDSLITIHDLIFPTELMGEEDSTSTDSFSTITSNSADERCPSNLRNARQSYSQYSHQNEGQDLFHQADVVCSPDSNTKPHPLHHCNHPINVLLHPYPNITSFGNSVMHPFSQPVLLPGGFPVVTPSDHPINELNVHSDWPNRIQNTLNYQWHT